MLMPGLSDVLEDIYLDEILSTFTHISLHSADPGDTGDFELVDAGGSSYARQACPGFTESSGGSAFLLSPVDFPNLPTGPIPYLGFWVDDVFAGSMPSGYADVMPLLSTLRVSTDTEWTLD